MAVSKVQICNLALSNIHFTDTTISNFDTDTGKAASQCRIRYDVVRRFVLADHHWNFAGKRIALADIQNPPATWGYRYDYPSDCLQFRAIQKISKNAVPLPYQVEDDGTDGGLCILTDVESAIGIYTRDVENAALFSPSFVDALSWRMASELAAPLTGNLRIQEVCESVYRTKLAAAKSADGMEGQASAALNAPWERARAGEVV